MEDKADTESSRRHFTRYYFGDKTQPLQQQSGGLVVMLREASLLLGEELGRVIIKDISTGGAGVLVSSIIKVPKKALIVFPKESGIKPQKVLVVYTRQLNPALNFYGLQWANKRNGIVEQVQSHWGHLFEENDPSESGWGGPLMR